MNALLICLALVGVDLQARVPNEQPGVCWWACADSILGTKLVTQVQVSGFGRDDGADLNSVSVLCFLNGIEWTEVGIGHFYKSEPELVIATIDPYWGKGGGCHAVVVLGIRHRTVWRRSGNRMFETRVREVVMYDPNEPAVNQVLPWSEFTKIFKCGTLVRKPDVR